MLGSPTDFWGKLESRSGEVFSWHPLTHHCADVAACCEGLLAHTIIGRRLARLIGREQLDETIRARLCVLAALHDFGKFNSGFQDKALSQPAFVRGHVKEALGIIATQGRGVGAEFFRALPVAEIVDWGETPAAAGELLVAVICHHGKPYRLVQDADPAWWSPRYGRSPFDGIRELYEKAVNWYPACRDDGAKLPASPPFQHAFAGVVMLADWLGSSTQFFPFSEHLDVDPITRSRSLASTAFERMGLTPDGARLDLGAESPGFARFTPFEPYESQSCVADAPVHPEGSLTVLEAETGSGKTEAAFGRYLRLFHAGVVDGMYFALPTRAAATQIHARIVKATRTAFPSYETRPPVVLAVPGYIKVDDASATILSRFEYLWNDDLQERFRYRGWAAENSKRFVAGSIVVGTIDQVLLSTIVVSHAHLRATALLRHLLVVDEVHASDPYMNRLLESVLRFHLDAGGQALLMTATLGSDARTRLLATAGANSGTPTIAEAIDTPYPAISTCLRSSSPGRTSSILGVRSPGNPKTFRVTLQRWMDNIDAIATQAVGAAAQGAHVLVIRNTVNGCIDTQRAIEAHAHARGIPAVLLTCGGVPAPHHSRFAGDDRRALDVAIEKAFGKGRQVEGRIAVATQTVQQSLDLDADLMISDLCPMDVLLQRAGRLHRHPSALRPDGFEHAELIVLVPSERNLGTFIRANGSANGPHGLGTVYQDLRTLEATYRLLEEHREIEIPRMARLVVEKATHPDSLAAIVSQLGAPWYEHERHQLGARMAQVSAGATNVLDRSRPFGDLEFPTREISRRIASRLGESDRIIDLGTVMGPFENLIDQISLPHHMAKGLPAEIDVRCESSERGSLNITLSTKRFVYDRLGIREFKD